MDGYDVKRALPALYAPRRGGFAVVEVPEREFLMIDGHGDPNTSAEYEAAVQTLYVLSYAVRAAAKDELGRVHTVAPLEGLWSADDPASFVRREKDAWSWTMMVSQPDWIDDALVDRARDAARRKDAAALDLVRFESFAEGTSVQRLHIGSYDDEGPVLRELHDVWMPENGYVFNGRHHEIYLSDARRTAPEKLRTILRQPIRPA